jgi:hypothetical protein
MTGQQIETEIFFGPTYYMRLKHMVKDKINFRTRGPNTNLTKQPVSGRANDGGLRIGEMERDAVVSHGATAFLQESMLVRADDYQMAICNQSGSIAIYNPKKNIMLSPSVDGPLKYTKTLDSDEDIVQQISKFGRSFSIVRVPYSLKLLMQEMLAINVKMSIITEDNVSQMENMKFSNNIDLLLGKKNATPNMVINRIKKALDNEETVESLYDETPTPTPVQPFDPQTPSLPPPSQQYNTESPSYVSTFSPVSPVSPVYMPSSNEIQSPNSNDSSAFDINANYNENENEDEIMTGGAVHCRGDVKPRIWIVVEKRGRQYVIETQDPEGLIPGDTVRKVGRNDIYFPDDSFVYAQKDQLDIAQPYQDPAEMMFNTPMINPVQQQAMQVPPAGINFAPTIRIVQGDDNSKNTESVSEPVEETIQPFIQDNNNIAIEPVNTSNASPYEPENSVDFQNIKIIKKE